MPVKISDIRVNLRHFNRHKMTGTMCLSKHYLMILDETRVLLDYYILLRSIDSIKLISDFTLELKCKNFKTYQIQLMKENNDQLSMLHSNLNFAINEDKVDELFPFVYKPTFNIIENGWNAFLLKEEFTELLMGGNWSLIRNEVCNSYDITVILPSKSTTMDIKKSASIHVNNRYPVLAFHYKPNQSALLRCSQYVGQDKMGSIDPMIKQLKFNYCFIDVRSKANINAVALEGRMTKDGIFPVEKVEHLLGNFQKYIEAIQDLGGNVQIYLQKIESCHWLDRVRQQLYIARYVAHCLFTKPSNYIVVGDTGYDYELIVTSLVQIILVSDARTIRGFQALVDREWIQAGHPFFDRCKNITVSRQLANPNAPGAASMNAATHNSNGPLNNDLGIATDSPVFLLFLDCVWQILQFNPTSFEFNSKFLKALAHHAYFSEFGTFLGNCAEHREFYNIVEDTTSLWSYMNQHDVMENYLNHLYEPIKQEAEQSICWPPVTPQEIQVWLDLYTGYSEDEGCCYNDSSSPNSSLIASSYHAEKYERELIKNIKTEKINNGKMRKLLENITKDLSSLNILAN